MMMMMMMMRRPPVVMKTAQVVMKSTCLRSNDDFRVGFGRLEFDVERDIAKISKTKLERESGELF